jgi:hypothetical protein
LAGIIGLSHGLVDKEKIQVIANSIREIYGACSKNKPFLILQKNIADFCPDLPGVIPMEDYLEIPDFLKRARGAIEIKRLDKSVCLVAPEFQINSVQRTAKEFGFVVVKKEALLKS